MLRNNLYTLMFHIVWSIFCFFIYPTAENDTSLFTAILYYILFISPYFIFSFVLHKQFKCYQSKLMNLLSVSSIIVINVLLCFLDLFMSNFLWLYSKRDAFYALSCTSSSYEPFFSRYFGNENRNVATNFLYDSTCVVIVVGAGITEVRQGDRSLVPLSQ